MSKDLEEKEARKIFLKGNEVKKKNSEEEMQGGSLDGSYFWKDRQGTN